MVSTQKVGPKGRHIEIPEGYTIVKPEEKMKKATWLPIYIKYTGNT